MNSAQKLLQFEFDADDFARRASQPVSIPTKRLAVLKNGISRFGLAKSC